VVWRTWFQPFVLVILVVVWGVQTTALFSVRADTRSNLSQVPSTDTVTS
jgi:hypothetical protein